MALAFAVLFLLTVVAFLYARDRSDARMDKEREDHRTELQSVLNRIQHPQVYEPSAPANSTGSHHLPYDDSAAWKEWVENGSNPS